MISNPYVQGSVPPFYLLSPIDSKPLYIPTLLTFPERTTYQSTRTQISPFKLILVIAVITIPLLATVGVILGLTPLFISETDKANNLLSDTTTGVSNSTDQPIGSETTENLHSNTTQSNITTETTNQLNNTTEEIITTTEMTEKQN